MAVERKRFSMYISMLWPEQNLMYEFYDESNSTNTINHLENLDICEAIMVGKELYCMGQCIISYKQNDKRIYK